MTPDTSAGFDDRARLASRVICHDVGTHDECQLLFGSAFMAGWVRAVQFVDVLRYWLGEAHCDCCYGVPRRFCEPSRAALRQARVFAGFLHEVLDFLGTCFVVCWAASSGTTNKYFALQAHVGSMFVPMVYSDLRTTVV